MKISDQTYQEMKEGFSKVVDHFGKDKLIESAKAYKTPVAFMWRIWSLIVFDWTSDDNHPFYGDGPGCGRKRINPYRDRMWTIYTDGIHDAHIETALKKICKELGLPYQTENSKLYPRKQT